MFISFFKKPDGTFLMFLFIVSFIAVVISFIFYKMCL